eukprot:EG_transcript_28247
MLHSGASPDEEALPIPAPQNVTAERVLLASFKVKAQYRARIEALAAMRRNGLVARPQKAASQPEPCHYSLLSSVGFCSQAFCCIAGRYPLLYPKKTFSPRNTPFGPGLCS